MLVVQCIYKDLCSNKSSTCKELAGKQKSPTSTCNSQQFVCIDIAPYQYLILFVRLFIYATLYIHVGSSPTRGSSFFLGKVTALGVLCCFALFVCLTLLASFFLPSHLSFKNMYMYMHRPVHTCTHIQI